MSKKSIPNGDTDFVTLAELFARTIAAEPARFEVSPADVETLTTAVAQFRAALQAARFGARSQAVTAAKDQAREQAERIVRRLRNVIRNNDRLSAATKILLGIKSEKSKPVATPCPIEPPRLKFVRALHESNAVPVHELDFRALKWTLAKPPGAVRLELFVDLIPPDEQVPTHPGTNQGSRPWYLRSYTKSPIRITPPMARVPMRVVYWGRWADAMGNVGPFSATAVAWIEGGCGYYLPGGTGIALGGRKPVPILEDVRPIVPQGRSESYRVALLEVQIESFGVQSDETLPEAEQREIRQLEGPQSEAA